MPIPALVGLLARRTAAAPIAERATVLAVRDAQATVGRLSGRTAEAEMATDEPLIAGGEVVVIASPTGETFALGSA